MSRYSNEDVQGWRQSANATIAKLEPKRGVLDSQPKQNHVLYVLAMMYVDLAICDITEREYVAAKQMLTRSCHTMIELYELLASGFPSREPRSAGDFQWLLHACAGEDVDGARRLASYMSTSAPGPADSVYFCGFIKSLLLQSGDLEQWRDKPFPSDVEPEFTGYPECLSAIALRDAQGFCDALLSATEAWDKYNTAHHWGMPDNVCFLGGIGLANLAKTAGLEFEFQDERLPEGMMRP